MHAALTAGLLACVAPAALADGATYCVTCKNPDQTYRCKVTGVGSRPADALKLYCVIRTAKDGNHASCSAQASSSGCVGIARVYSYKGPPIPDLASDPRVRAFKQKFDHDQRAFKKPKGAAPKTLVELTGRAVRASRKGLRNAGSALGISSGSDEEGLPTKIQPTESRVQRVKHAAQDAGAAVGSFARKSYRCLFSLFRNCSGESEDGQAPN